MKTSKKIILGIFMILCIITQGQNIEIVNTKELITISESNGLDYALKMTARLPIYYIDSLTAVELIRHVNRNAPTNRIENFLVDYALRFDNSELQEIIYNFFEKKKDMINSYEPEKYGGLPNISNDDLLAIIKYKNNRTELQLIDFYIAWKEKSEINKSEYIQGIQESNIVVKEQLMTPYQDCNLNCYRLLLALDSINSSFPDSLKFEEHNKYLKEYYQNTSLYETGDFTNYQLGYAMDSIEFSHDINSIGELNFKKTPELKQLIKGYGKSYCWKKLMFNNKVGYLDLGCQSAPLAGQGIFLRLEIKDKKLIIYRIQSWIS